MMRNAIITSVLNTFLCVGCVSQTKYNKALSTIDSLKIENSRLSVINEELENGEARLASLYTQLVRQGKYLQAEETYYKAVARHPQASSNTAYEDINSVRQKAQVQRDSIDKAKRDSLFLANIDDIGEWSIGDYVDDFKEPTGEHFVQQFISGHFSNSATAGSRLAIRVMVHKSYYREGALDYSIQFDEYGDGTIDNKYLGNSSKAVCKNLHKVYVRENGTYFYDKEEGYGSASKYYSLLDLLRMEDEFEITDTHREYSISTIYNFTIDSRKLNNALVKAGILSVEDVLHNSN